MATPPTDTDGRPAPDAAAALSALEAAVSTRTAVADRVWAWAYVAHALAIAEITDAADATPAGQSGTSAAVWVTPQMAWALDDLVDAGVRATPPAVPLLNAGVRRDAITRALRHMIVTADLTDDAAPDILQDAVRGAGRRAVLAYEAYAGQRG